MAQVKIYGLRRRLTDRRQVLSSAIHAAVTEALDYPPEKRFHRFIGLDDADFVYPDDRGEDYTIIEISLFEGRTAEARKDLIRRLFHHLEHAAGISPRDVEITLFQTPRQDWGIRGQTGDELSLGYRVDV